MNIAVVGGGIGGSKIISLLKNVENVNVKIVIDKNFDAIGIKLAKSMNINISQSIDDIDPDQTDIIIEVTGNENVSKIIYEKYGQKCKIIDAEGALLITEIASHDEMIFNKLNKKIEDINNAASIIQLNIKNITNSVEKIDGVSDRLINLANISKQYIKQSDEIIEYVNNIAMQTKVLGINATIEAARAGEHGRTFGVVAKEIQDLAGNSESYAKNINNILTKLAEEIDKLNNEVSTLEKLSQKQIEATEVVNSTMNNLMV
ncbi:Semialdehyde dehydrogenase, NAD binding domain [Caloramator quimbayensis]|uniref:Semialdehyde dehydrogenase, NAD binding domain n=1 Tax=Caloramator quimbayensis TaxID=1147123 RepID=A0A1T4YC32_9CLOT|nr:methyl-accepting chemotaxis protein [Caloramator quimbayensis]SKA98851.1 Semialdehyde dehydrogenase, NAD binding domain [Caloramator quimbayensis]